MFKRFNHYFLKLTILTLGKSPRAL